MLMRTGLISFISGNFSERALSSTIELVPEVGPQIGTLVPKPGPPIQIIDPLSRKFILFYTICKINCMYLGPIKGIKNYLKSYFYILKVKTSIPTTKQPL